VVFRASFIVFVFLVFACSSSRKAISSELIDISETDSIAGKEVVEKNDCFTCHKFEEKLIGPSFSSVAKKYPATNENITRLSRKILEGGRGVWGKLPMLPHPSLSQSDAEKIVKYILLLKK
jgi:cytochrome c